MGNNRKKRAMEVLTKELNEVIYVNMKERILGRITGEQDARFERLVRSGVIVRE